MITLVNNLFIKKKSLTDLAGLLKITVPNLSTIVAKSTLYLNQFLFSYKESVHIEGEEYTRNLKDGVVYPLILVILELLEKDKL